MAVSGAVCLGQRAPGELETPQPAAQDVRDRRYGLSLHTPAGWELDHKDGVLSSFHKDVRSADGFTLRSVAVLNYNPYPDSTFAGAAFYFSVLSRSTAATCAARSAAAPVRPQPDVTIASVPFRHGRDQHGTICTESRDDVFTAGRGGSCLRFDLVVNTFCSQTSGAMELTRRQWDDIDSRLAGILQSIRLDAVPREH